MTRNKLVPYLRALASFFTFFGGHVLNRRLDRVLLVFAALVAVGMVCYLVLPTLIVNAIATESVAGLLRIPAILLVAVACVSAALTWMDTRAPIAPPLPMGSRIAGGIVSLFGLMLLSVAIMSSYSARVPERSTRSNTQLSPPEHPSTTRHSLYTSTHLGGFATTSDPPPPPAGPHALRGRIMLAGRPVQDARLQLLLNQAFETDARSTNARGEFEVKLPAGKWFINRVTVTDWDGAPAGRMLLLFSEHEAEKGSGYYSRRDHGNGTGLEVDLPAANGSSIPTFELRDAITVQWPAPAPGAMDEHPTVQTADLATSEISWIGVPTATEYEIQLSSIERKDHSTSYQTILRRRQGNTRLPLADLPQSPRQSPKPSEYAVTIYAFDSDGRLLTQSDDRLGEIAFSLAGDMRLAEERAPSLSRLDRTEYFQNLERLSLVAGLLDHKQLDAARAILKEVTDDAPPGRAAAMQGAIEALAGNCAAALPLFDKADAAGGLGCAPLKYRHMCEQK